MALHLRGASAGAGTADLEPTVKAEKLKCPSRTGWAKVQGPSGMADELDTHCP